MRVLFVNHGSEVSGAERSLLVAMGQVKQEASVLLVCPPGDLARRASAIGIETIELDTPGVGFDSSPRAILRAALGYARVGIAIRSIAKRESVDCIHAASTRAGLMTAFCVLTSAKRLVDVRDILPGGARALAVRFMLRLTADLLVFNSEFTRERFGPSRPARSLVVYPRIALETLVSLPLPAERRRTDAPTLGVVGQLTPWKGQDTAIEILALVRAQIPEVKLRIVGKVVFSRSTSLDNESYARRLRATALNLGVEDAVEFVDESEDLRSLFASLDVLLVPSWEEPFGRIVAEAMTAGVPVVATSVGGPSELIEHGVSGLLAPPREPEAWVEPVTSLLRSVDVSHRTAAAARRQIASRLAEAHALSQIDLLYRRGGTHLPSLYDEAFSK